MTAVATKQTPKMSRMTKLNFVTRDIFGAFIVLPRIVRGRRRMQDGAPIRALTQFLIELAPKLRILESWPKLTHEFRVLGHGLEPLGDVGIAHFTLRGRLGFNIAQAIRHRRQLVLKRRGDGCEKLRRRTLQHLEYLTRSPLGE